MDYDAGWNGIHRRFVGDLNLFVSTVSRQTMQRAGAYTPVRNGGVTQCQSVQKLVLFSVTDVPHLRPLNDQLRETGICLSGGAPDARKA